MALRYSLTVLVLVLAGCGEIEAQPAPTNSQEFVAQLVATCDAYGYRRGTDAHAQCVQQLHQQAVTAAAYDARCNRPLPGNTLQGSSDAFRRARIEGTSVGAQRDIINRNALEQRQLAGC